MLFNVNLEQNMDDKMEISDGLCVRPIIETEHKLLYKWANEIGYSKKDMKSYISDKSYTIGMVSFNDTYVENDVGVMITKHNNNSLAIELLYIDTDYRSKGYGNSIISYIRNLCRQYKIFSVSIKLPIDNKKINFTRVFKFLINAQLINNIE